MALTANAIPSQVPLFTSPYDAQLAFCSAQVVVATGFLNNLNSGLIDLGGASPSSGAGRTDFMWNMDITAANFGTADESYTFRLLGSNDVNFANGNVELLAMHDIAATAALRNLTAVLGATPTIPPVGLAGTIFQFPATNLMQRIVYRWLKCHMVAVGTGPSVTVTSWISRADIEV